MVCYSTAKLIYNLSRLQETPATIGTSDRKGMDTASLISVLFMVSDDEGWGFFCDVTI